jgi:protein arginine N-methyltransferase 1
LWSSDVDEHRRYLSDETRMEAYQAAIRDVVRPGDVVLDVGTGTGVLGLLACRAGARRVYSVDRGPIIELARRICAANGLQDRVVFLKGLSTEIDLPEKVDVVVADQLDCAGFEAGTVTYFADAKTRFLKPNGRMIPRAIEFCVAAVQCDETWQDIAFWEQPQAGLSFSPAYQSATNVAYAIPASAVTLLSGDVIGQKIEFAEEIPEKLDINVRLPVGQAGTFHGLLCWFSARLSEQATLTNSPLCEKRAQRRCTFLPLRKPVEVEPQDKIECSVKSPFNQHLVHWTVAIQAHAQERATEQFRSVHSTFLGQFLCAEDLSKTTATYRPQLGRRAHALLSALHMMKGNASVLEIQSRLRSEYPCLFASDDECSAFVAEVVRKHSL